MREVYFPLGFLASSLPRCLIFPILNAATACALPSADETEIANIARHLYLCKPPRRPQTHEQIPRLKTPARLRAIPCNAHQRSRSMHGG